MLIAFNKPFGVLSQFSRDGSPNRSLSEFKLPSRIYPLGRLDADSEGLLLLSDEAGLNTRLLDPKQGHRRTYWALVERIPTAEQLKALGAGIEISRGERALPCKAWSLNPQPLLPERIPPVRFRKNVTDHWIALELTEGKNRQVRRMTAAIGHPTLRLIRVRIGDFDLGGLPQGEWLELREFDRRKVFAG